MAHETLKSNQLCLAYTWYASLISIAVLIVYQPSLEGSSGRWEIGWLDVVSDLVVNIINNEYWAKWSQVFMSAMHHCIPCKTVPIKCNTPWINQEIRSSIRKRWSLFHRLKRSKCYDCLVKYRSLRNSIVNWICKAKKEFFVKLANSRSNLKAFWATIRKLQPWNSSPSVLSNGSATATSDLDKANLF